MAEKKTNKNRFKWLQKEVVKEFSASKKTYASPRICIVLNQRGVEISKSKVVRILKKPEIL